MAKRKEADSVAQIAIERTDEEAQAKLAEQRDLELKAAVEAARRQRLESCQKEIDAALAKHRCGLDPVLQLSKRNGLSGSISLFAID